jgi:ATP-dependent RNA helicase DeaD
MDHLRRGTLRLDALQAIVLDEADEMLKMGFIDDVEWILEQCPEEKQVALFSATMPPRIRNVAKKHLKDAEEIHVRVSQKTLELVEQFYWQITGTHRLDALARILEVENYQGVLIFVRTKSATLELSEKLRSRGYSSAALNGDMNQRDRERTIQRLKDSKVDIVIATDVAARGLDVDRITHVVNYDIPYDAETYVHRIGRTGRAGRSGKAILFVAPREKRLLRTIERATKGTISPLTLPTRDELIEIRQNILKKKIIKIAEKRDLVPQSKMIEELMAENEISAVQVAAALTHLIQRDQEPIPQDISSSDRPPRNRPHARFSKNKGNRRSDSGERGGRKFQRRDKRHGGGGSPKRRSPGSGRPNNRNASR